MAKLTNDHLEFIKLLNKFKVKYLIIGGYAVNNYGYDRQTYDFDIFFGSDHSNVKRLIVAIKDFGFDISDLTTKDFANEMVMFSLGSRKESGHIELTNRIAGIDFENAFPNRKVEIYHDTEINFIGLKDLINTKKATARLKDKDDYDHLIKIYNINKK